VNVVIFREIECWFCAWNYPDSTSIRLT